MKFKFNKTQFIVRGHADVKDAKFIIVPVPYERTTSYGQGTKNGPDAILRASSQLELWDEETRKEIWKCGMAVLAPLNCSGSEKVFFQRLEKETAGILSSFKGIPIFLGGEHSVTQGLLPPFQKKYGDLSILHFDAHADLRPEYRGSDHSHACALYGASRTSRTVQIGIRSVGSDEKQYVNAGKVKTYFMHENQDFDRLERNILKDLSGTVYMSLDVDGFDPSVMPGTGTPQPGGFMWYDALKLFKVVCKKKKVVGLDIMETCPVKGSNITEFAVAKLIYRLMGYLGAAR